MIKRNIGKMKIVFTALKYLPHIGGIEIYIHELAQHLIKNGWTVTIVSADVDCVTIVREIIDHEKVIRIPASEIAKFPIIKKRHIHIIEDEIKDADVVHMNVCKLLVDYFVNKKKQYKYKLVMSSHGWLYHTSKNKNM